MTFQELILTLQQYWGNQGCLLTQPYDVEKGAGTFNPSTFLRSLGPEPFNAAYAEPCRRPADGRYGNNPIRMQHYYQFQVMMKPCPENILELYLGSLKAIGIFPDEHDIRFVHDDWETAALGAWGLGWEVWCDGTEITQFTYFQQVGGLELGPITGEITYGLERLCMFLQKASSVFNIQYNEFLTYGDVFHENEVQFSLHNFELADTDLHLQVFEKYRVECIRLCESGTPAPALDCVMKASHAFNILDARNAISVNERQNFVMKIRELAKATAEAWIKSRGALGYPLSSKVLRPPAEAPEQDWQGAIPEAHPSLMQESAPLLIELGVEEMPAAVFKGLLSGLPGLWQKLTAPSKLASEAPQFFVTPRRIALYIPSLQTRQPDEHLELKGPPAGIAKDKDGNWTPAAVGFAKKNGIDLKSLQTRTFGSAEYLYAEVERKGRTAVEILAEIIPEFFSKIHWYKNMRWADGNTVPFVRPVRWLAAILGSDVIPVEFGGARSGNISRGHRFLSSAPVLVTPDTYLDDMKNGYVIADQAERKSQIHELLIRTAGEQQLIWREDEDLLDQVTHLVEFPVPVLGSFDEKFLEIPEEVIVSEMRNHQKYFALRGRDGKLANSFIAISNMNCKDMSLVRKGYENVLLSRLTDAEFFLKEDLKKNLADRVDRLRQLTFEAALGTIHDKMERFFRLSQWLAAEMGIDSRTVGEIARLSKADLTTLMVFEFPELQGEMGRHYALAQGLSTVVADGIRDHYLPRDAYDRLPPARESAAVGIADRIDTIVGLFGIGKVPTGSSDPLGLRRACLACVSIMVSQAVKTPLDCILEKSIEIYGNLLAPDQAKGLKETILAFFRSRIQKLFQDAPRPGLPGGMAWDTVESVLNAKASWFNLTDLSDRLTAMQQFRERKDFTDVASTFKRVSNILEKDVSTAVDAALFEHDEERALFSAVEKGQSEIDAFLGSRDYLSSLLVIAALRPLVDTLFNVVLINHPNEAVRANRHGLIQKVKNLVSRVADFSVIQE